MPTANRTMAHTCLRDISWRCAAVDLEDVPRPLEPPEREEIFDPDAAFDLELDLD